MTRGAVLIVRNEAATIERCLASARAAGVTVVTIADTGSQDGTQEIIGRACSGRDARGRFQRPMDLRLHEIPWENFGQARSAAFALARGSADWLLALDADCTVQWDEGFDPTGPDAWMIDLGTPGFVNRLPLLLKGDLPWISRGAVHEYTLLESGEIGRRESTNAVRITHHGEGRGSPGKTRWHAQLLEDELRREPDNERTIFYLAEAYRFLGLTEISRSLYQRRATMYGFEEERWYAQYRAATLIPDWPARLDALLGAWEARPSRLEPLYDACKGLNERDRHYAVYRLTEGLAGPCADEMFVHRDAWDWGLQFERAIACWYTGHRDEFERLSMQLLGNERLPDDERAAVIRNLSLKAA